jgi:hypothetical protein
MYTKPTSSWGGATEATSAPAPCTSWWVECLLLLMLLVVVALGVR